MLRLILVATAGVLAPCACAANTIPDLGSAGDFALLGLNKAHYVIQSSAIAGNIGIGQSGTANNTSSGAVGGTAFEFSSGQITNSGFISGGITVNSTELTNANSGALSAYSTAVGDTVTQTVGAISGTKVITGNGGLNVVDISTVNLSGANITLNGTASDIFVLRVSGNFTMSGNSSILLGSAVTPENVLIVFTGTSKTINVGITGSATVNGTLLAPSTSTNWQITSGSFNGEIITGTPATGGGTFLTLKGVALSGAPFKAVPEPSSLVLAGIATVGLVSLLRSTRKRPSQSLDLITP